MGKTMKPGGKRVALRGMAVLVIVLGVIVLAFMPREDARQAQARRLLDEIRPPSKLDDFLEWLGLARRRHRTTSFLGDYEESPEIVEDLARLGPPAIPVLTKALTDNDEDDRVRLHAALALGEMGPQAAEATPSLIQALKQRNEMIATRAASALGKIGPPAKDAVPALIDALKAGDWSLRCWAAETLGRIGPAAKAAVPALEEALKDEQARFYAAEALAKLGLPEKGLPVLIALLEDKSSSWREAAAEALGDIGPPAKAAIPALRGALKDEQAHVRKAAAEALKKIQADGRP